MQSPENRESCDMVRVVDREAVHAGPVGSFCIVTAADGDRMLWHKLPNAMVGFCRLRPVRSGAPAHPSWKWDGNEDKPTLKPSVHQVGGWHGWITAGRMVSQ